MLEARSYHQPCFFPQLWCPPWEPSAVESNLFRDLYLLAIIWRQKPHPDTLQTIGATLELFQRFSGQWFYATLVSVSQCSFRKISTHVFSAIWQLLQLSNLICFSFLLISRISDLLTNGILPSSLGLLWISMSLQWNCTTEWSDRYMLRPPSQTRSSQGVSSVLRGLCLWSQEQLLAITVFYQLYSYSITLHCNCVCGSLLN